MEFRIPREFDLILNHFQRPIYHSIGPTFAMLTPQKPRPSFFTRMLLLVCSPRITIPPPVIRLSPAIPFRNIA